MSEKKTHIIFLSSGQTIKITGNTFENIKRSKSQFIVLPTGEMVNKSFIVFIKEIFQGYKLSKAI